MDKKYIDLFKELTRTTATTAERVMDYDHELGDEKGLETAQIMRDDFEKLHDRLENDDYQMTKGDAAKLLVGSMIIVNNLYKQEENIKKSIAGYQTDLIPKLQKIVDTASDDASAAKIANENFIFENNE